MNSFRSQDMKIEQERIVQASQSKLRAGSSEQESLTLEQNKLMEEAAEAARRRSRVQAELDAHLRQLSGCENQIKQLSDLKARAEEQMMQDTQVILQA